MHVAVFDTTFHRTMPAHAREYALPRELAREHGIRRYGFHGTSHEYVARRAAAMLGRPLSELNLITLHLGNGASVSAIEGGRSIDTSMGMTPLEGLVMGTRCGDVDPAVPMLLGEITGRSREEVHHLLNFESGLLGLSGESDMREVHRLAERGRPGRRGSLSRCSATAPRSTWVRTMPCSATWMRSCSRRASGSTTRRSGRASAAGLERLGIEIAEEENRRPQAEGGCAASIRRRRPPRRARHQPAWRRSRRAG